ncbi:hypothetical protein BZL54_19360 [Burkholderia ubonensis subsp. mesacidophila]|uniref:Uncharacterized protein n=1 Tax=Burkholderia ubonensis subsp. mesacidophila TaxID=265293 RepID=A0A2A4FDW2_9BURK|nr:hypothetical protein BZL54_19360 [Burkholderia ubonensis subsp. mesacidophila]
MRGALPVSSPRTQSISISPRGGNGKGRAARAHRHARSRSVNGFVFNPRIQFVEPETTRVIARIDQA